MRAAWFLPLLALGACTTGWPQKSVVNMQQDSDATALAPAIAACIQMITPLQKAVALPTGQGSVGSLVADELMWRGVPQASDGIPVTYLGSPLDNGAFIRATEPAGICSQWLARTQPGQLVVGGPLMIQVAK